MIYSSIMTPKYAITYINRLVKKYGSRKDAAMALGVDPRYIYMLQKKERKASPHLIKLIKLLLKG